MRVSASNSSIPNKEHRDESRPPTVLSSLVEVRHILIEDTLKLPLAEDQQVVKAFLPHTPQKPFADRIGTWCMKGSFENLDSTR